MTINKVKIERTSSGLVSQSVRLASHTRNVRDGSWMVITGDATRSEQDEPSILKRD